MPGMYKKEPPFGGPTIKRRELVQVQGMIVRILPPKVPPKLKGIERALVNKGDNKKIKIKNTGIKKSIFFFFIDFIISSLRS